MVSRSGTKHGLLVALVALIVWMFLAVVGRGRVRPLGQFEWGGDTGGTELRPAGVEHGAHALWRPRPDLAVPRRRHRRVCRARTGTRRAGGGISPWSGGSIRSSTSGPVRVTSRAEDIPRERLRNGL